MLKHRKSYRTPFEQLESRSLMSATLFDQTNLVSDQFGVAQIQDKHLINPWGIALNPKTGAFWLADNDAGVATLYSGDVKGSALAKAPNAKAALDSFPPSAQRDYFEWIAEAKQDGTRQKRIATAIEWLDEGKRRHWKYQNC